MKFLLAVLVIHLVIAFISNRKENKKMQQGQPKADDALHPAEYLLR